MLIEKEALAESPHSNQLPNVARNNAEENQSSLINRPARERPLARRLMNAICSSKSPKERFL